MSSGRREARLAHPDGGEDEGGQQRVHDEACAVLTVDRLLAELVLDEGSGSPHGVGRGEQ